MVFNQLNVYLHFFTWLLLQVWCHGETEHVLKLNWHLQHVTSTSFSILAVYNSVHPILAFLHLIIKSKVLLAKELLCHGCTVTSEYMREHKQTWKDSKESQCKKPIWKKLVEKHAAAFFMFLICRRQTVQCLPTLAVLFVAVVSCTINLYSNNRHQRELCLLPLRLLVHW